MGHAGGQCVRDGEKTPPVCGQGQMRHRAAGTEECRGRSNRLHVRPGGDGQPRQPRRQRMPLPHAVEILPVAPQPDPALQRVAGEGRLAQREAIRRGLRWNVHSQAKAVCQPSATEHITLRTLQGIPRVGHEHGDMACRQGTCYPGGAADIDAHTVDELWRPSDRRLVPATAAVHGEAVAPAGIRHLA